MNRLVELQREYQFSLLDVGWTGLKLSAGVFAVAAVVICWIYRKEGFWSSSSANAPWIGGPPGRFLRGNTRDLDAKGESSAKLWYALYKRYGPAYELTIPFYRMHIINHPAYLEHIQKTNHKNYVRGAFARLVFGELHRTGIFVADGKEWQFQRKAATRAFSKQNFETHITASLHHWLDILMRLLHNLAKRDQAFDLQELLQRFLFCLFLRIAFHEEELARGVLSDDPECLKSIPEFVEAYDKAHPMLDRRRRDSLWKLNERLSGDDKVTSAGIASFYGVIDGLIKKRLDAMANGYKPNPDVGVDLLDVFLQSTTDIYTLGGMVFSFLNAGRDTTAYTTAWMVKEMYHKDNLHLDAARKMRAELEEQGLNSGYLDYADAPRLKFANAMWDETARLDTVAPAGQMEAAEDDTLPAIPEFNIPPRKIKKGDLVAFQNYVISRMPEVWGDDATMFNPNRWFKSNGEGISYSPFKYHSWNAGPRSCLGRALATYEGIAIVSAILQRFDIVLQDPVKEYEPLAALNMGIKDGLWIKVKEQTRGV